MNAFTQVAAGAASAGTCAAIGGAVIAASGMSAAGMVGGGAGIGAAAGPVGAVFGAVAGLAVFGVVVTANAVRKEPVVQETVRSARQRVGRWVSGDTE